MKRRHTIFFMWLALGISACSDFLNEELEGTYSNDTFYKTETHATLALTGVYNMAAFNATNNVLWVFGDVASDDAIRGGKPGDEIDIDYINDFNYISSNVNLDRIWKQNYEGITRANYLLYYGPDIQMDTKTKNRILGEAKFLRAYFYFNLVNIFGDIPLKLNPPINQSEIYKARSPVATVYQQIEQDLKDAKSVLEKSYTGANVGRATKGAAWGLLAKTYLYQQKWTEALEAIYSVDQLGLYSLEPVYKNSFLDSTQNNSESIFEIQHTSGQLGVGSYLSQYFTPVEYNGYAFNAPTEDFVNEFETAIDPAVIDPRLDYTVGREGQTWINGELYKPDWSSSGYLQKKHIQPLRAGQVNNDAALNYVYLRYADILLMKAEVLNELDRPDDALVPLNAVRKRARESYLYDVDLPGYGAIPEGLLEDIEPGNKTQIGEAIRHERRVELGFEFHRFFDLMRYGQAAAEEALEETDFSYSTHRYFLIPQSEIDTNPSINN